MQVQWPGGTVDVVPPSPWTAADTHCIFPLNYVARPGDPVTVMTARKGLRVTRRHSHGAGQERQTRVAGPAAVGTLLWPVEVDDTGVWWDVEWGASKTRGCHYVSATHMDTCDLQVGVSQCDSTPQHDTCCASHVCACKWDN